MTEVRRFPHISVNQAAQKRWHWQQQRQQFIEEMNQQGNQEDQVNQQQILLQQNYHDQQQILLQQNYHDQQNAYLQNYIQHQNNLDLAKYHKQDRSQQVEQSQVNQLLANLKQEVLDKDNNHVQLNQRNTRP